MKDHNWSILFKTAAYIAWITLALIPIQIAIFIIFPPPTKVLDFYTVFQENAIIGLLNLDFLYLLTVLFMGYLYLAFYAALKDKNKSYSLIALTLGLIGVAVYFVSNVSFEMLTLSHQYQLAETNEEKVMLTTVGKVMLTKYKGTAFGVYYILNGLSLILFSLAMLKSSIFSRKVAKVGLIAGILMLVPTTVGLVGMIFGLSSLIPTSIWLVMIAKRLNMLARTD